jgi:hypothetical protein
MPSTEARKSGTERRGKTMAREEIIKELDRVQTAMFMATMADFMNWPNYYKLQAEERKLKEMLED